MTCGRCGKNNADNLKFCTGCGESLVSARAQPRICSYCGSDIEAGNPFCGICGRQASQARQAQQANAPTPDMRRPAEPRRQGSQQPLSRQHYGNEPYSNQPQQPGDPRYQNRQQPYDDQPYDRQYQTRQNTASNQQFRRQPQGAQTRQGQRRPQQRRKTGFAGLPISRNAFIGIVGGVAAVVLIIVIITSLTGGGLSGTYISAEGMTIRFSGRNFTLYEGMGDNQIEIDNGTFTIEGDIITFDFGDGEPGTGTFDSSRDIIIWAGLRFVNERDGAVIEQPNQPPDRDGQVSQPTPAPEAPAPQPPDSTSPLEGVWVFGHDVATFRFIGDEIYITAYSSREFFDEELSIEFYDWTPDSFPPPPPPPPREPTLLGRGVWHPDFTTLIETVVDEERPYVSREFYRFEIMGTFSISSTAQGDLIEIVWEDGFIRVFGLLYTQNTMTISDDDARHTINLTRSN